MEWKKAICNISEKGKKHSFVNQMFAIDLCLNFWRNGNSEQRKIAMFCKFSTLN